MSQKHHWAVWLSFALAIFVNTATGCSSTHTHRGGDLAGGLTAPSAPSPDTTAPSPDPTILGTWWNGVVLDVWSVTDDTQQIASDSTLQDPTILASDCSSLASDLHTLQSDPPAPDPSLNADWQPGLAVFARAGTECHTALTANNSQAGSAALSDLDAANKDLAPVFTKIIADLGETNSNDSAINFSSPPTGDNTTLDPWWNKVLGDYVSLDVDLSEISVAAEAHSYRARQAGCRVLTVAVRTLQHDPLPPDSSTSKHWKQSLKYYARGARECATGSTTPPDIKDLQASNSDIAAGNSNMIMVLTATVTGS